MLPKVEEENIFQLIPQGQPVPVTKAEDVTGIVNIRHIPLMNTEATTLAN